jgi:hypothetical protein
LWEKLTEGQDGHGEPIGRDELTAGALIQMIAERDTNSKYVFSMVVY